MDDDGGWFIPYYCVASRVNFDFTSNRKGNNKRMKLAHHECSGEEQDLIGKQYIDPKSSLIVEIKSIYRENGTADVARDTGPNSFQMLLQQ